MSGAAAALRDDHPEGGAAQPPAPRLDMTEDEIGGLARRLGWKPQEEYKGPPERWVDARSFVETADRNPAVMWSNLQTLDKRHAALEREFRENKAKLGEAVTMISDLSEQSRKISERSYERARRELIAERDAAVEAGDRQKFSQVDTELTDLEKNRPTPAQARAAPQPNGQAAPPTPAPPQEVQEWGRQNPWFYTDTDLQGEANALHMALLNTRPDLSISDNLASVSRTIKALHPEKFPNRATPVSKPAATDDDDGNAAPAGERPSGSAPRTASRAKRDYASIPRDAKTQYARYKEMIGRKEGAKPLTEAEWAQNYWDQFPEDGT